MEKKNLGLTALLKKTLAIIGASATSFFQGAQAKEPTPVIDLEGANINVASLKQKLKAKLVLKLNTSNINEGIVVMHTSHSSHSSHASHASHVSGSGSGGHYSHASHVSHSSHYSSVPSYSPSYSPSYNPSSSSSYSSPHTTIKHKVASTGSTHNTGTSNVQTYHALGSRTLFKGCRGTDVKELQQLLIKLGYDITASGYFDESTKIAVMDFQSSNYLTADGRVGSVTLLAIQTK